MIDYHSHLIPGIDDGAASLADSVAIARILSSVGFTVAHCTPHLIKGAFETPPARVRELTAFLRKKYLEEGIALRLVCGTEHYLDEYLGEYLEEAITVDGSRYLLVEAPFRCAPDVIAAYAGQIIQGGRLPLFAHPERCSAFAPAPEKGRFLAGIFRRRVEQPREGSLLAKLQRSGCRFQGNLGSFAGVYGEETRQRALRFLLEGVYSCVGSDAHRVERLDSVLKRGIATVEEAIGKDAAARLFMGEGLG